MDITIYLYIHMTYIHIYLDYSGSCIINDENDDGHKKFTGFHSSRQIYRKDADLTTIILLRSPPPLRNTLEGAIDL